MIPQGEARGPGEMRRAVADYAAALHRAYASAAAVLPVSAAAALPLMGDHFSVLAVGAGKLHLIATRQVLSLPGGEEWVGEGPSMGPLPSMRWGLRFLDPVVLPELGLVRADLAGASAEVRRVLGVQAWLYHLLATPRSGLSAHHAGHAGLALLTGHAREVGGGEAGAPRSPPGDRVGP